MGGFSLREELFPTSPPKPQRTVEVLEQVSELDLFNYQSAFSIGNCWATCESGTHSGFFSLSVSEESHGLS